MAGSDFRQSAVVAARQIVADLAELLLDDVEIVDEPFRGRSDRAALPESLRGRAVILQRIRPFSKTRGRRGWPASSLPRSPGRKQGFQRVARGALR